MPVCIHMVYMSIHRYTFSYIWHMSIYTMYNFTNTIVGLYTKVINNGRCE